MIKCVIFDCDGTLVDSEYLNSLGIEIKLAEYGIVEPAAQLMKKFRGMQLAATLAALEDKHKVKLDKQFIPAYRLLVEQLFEQRLQACEGVVDALNSIELPVCVASGGPLEKIKQALTLTGLSDYFGDNLYSSYEVGCFKPEPGLFLHVADDMGILPSQCIVIEDSTVGITAAKAASMHPVLYDPENGQNDDNGITVIQHMHQLPRVIADHSNRLV